MLPKDEPPFHPHFHDRHIKGCTLDCRDRSVFLKPGDTWTDQRGRKYTVADDGSLRRVKK